MSDSCGFAGLNSNSWCLINHVIYYQDSMSEPREFWSFNCDLGSIIYDDTM